MNHAEINNRNIDQKLIYMMRINLIQTRKNILKILVKDKLLKNELHKYQKIWFLKY